MKDELSQQIEERKAAAHGATDLDDYVFYSNVEREMRLLRLAVAMAAQLYKNTSNEDAWNALYEALSDTGMLDGGE